ncbi:hypothetical protein JST97_05755 [bacterium]|nr:hypothetical protein [bacterium]
MLDTYKIVVAHEYPIVRLDICAALAQVGRYEVVAESSDPAETLQLVGSCHPQLLILDSRMGGLATSNWLAFLNRTEPQMKVLLLGEACGQVPKLSTVVGVVGKGQTVQSLLQTVERIELGSQPK